MPRKKPPEVATVATDKPDPLEVLAQVKADSPELILRKRLQAPFPASDVRWIRDSDTATNLRPEVHPAAIMDRLDDVFGVDGWTAGYVESAHETPVIGCTIEGRRDGGARVRQSGLGDDWIKAFVLAAQHMGIGRYLGRLKHVRVGDKPVLPDWAVSNAPESEWPYLGCARTGVKVATVATQPEGPIGARSPDPVVDPSPTPDRPAKAPPEAKKEATKAAPKVETVDDRIQAWALKMTSCEKPEDLNEMIPAIKSEKEEWQVSIWKYVKRVAAGVGWEWDDQKKFHQGGQINF